MTSCDCLLSFILSTSFGGGSINPGSVLWTPETCHKTIQKAEAHHPSVLVKQIDYHLQKERLSFLPLPNTRLNGSGTWAYEYCLGEPRVKINGQWEPVIIEITGKE